MAALPRIRWESPSLTRRAMHTMVRGKRMLMREVPPPQLLWRPFTEGALTPKEDAIGLLKLAAEVEHALMIQYLYAAGSIKEDGPRNKVVAVAIQEMMHWMSVHNLLISLGGPSAIHVGRDQVRSASDLNPMPLTLEPATRRSLAKYVAAEMPESVEAEDLKKLVVELVALANEGKTTSIRQVGAIYDQLLWMFQPDDDARPPVNLTADELHRANWHLAAADFQTATVVDEHAGRRAEWHAGDPEYLLASPHDWSEGWQLLAAISQQGEGLGASHSSHFWEFLELVQDLDAGHVSVSNLATTPYGVHSPPLDAGVKTQITNGYTLLWSQLLDLRYTMLVTDVAQCLSLAFGVPLRTALSNQAIPSMRNVIAPLCARLSGMSLSEKPDSPLAGPTFGLAFDDLPLLSPDAYRDRQLALLAREKAVLDAIGSHASLPQDPNGGDHLRSFTKPTGHHARRKQIFP